MDVPMDREGTPRRTIRTASLGRVTLTIAGVLTGLVVAIWYAVALYADNHDSYSPAVAPMSMIGLVQSIGLVCVSWARRPNAPGSEDARLTAAFWLLAFTFLIPGVIVAGIGLEAYGEN